MKSVVFAMSHAGACLFGASVFPLITTGTSDMGQNAGWQGKKKTWAINNEKDKNKRIQY